MPGRLLAIGGTAEDAAQLGTIDVIGVSPAPGGELPENLLPCNVQRVDADDFERAQTLDATEYLERRIAGVTINSAQGNPLQADVQFRGFTGSPLLGARKACRCDLPGDSRTS